MPAAFFCFRFLLFFDSEVVSLFSAVVDMHVCKHHVIAKLITIVSLTCRDPCVLGWLGFGQGRLSGVPPVYSSLASLPLVHLFLYCIHEFGSAIMTPTQGAAASHECRSCLTGV